MLDGIGAPKTCTRSSVDVATPDGGSVVVVFETSFGKRERASEWVVVKRGADGTWAIGSYSIRSPITGSATGTPPSGKKTSPGWAATASTLGCSGETRMQAAECSGRISRSAGS